MKGWPTWITLATLSFVRMLLGSSEPKNSTIQVVRVGKATRPFWISCLICHESAIAPTDRAKPRCLQRPPQNKPTLIQSSNVMYCMRRISEYSPRDNTRLWYMSKLLQVSCFGCIGFLFIALPWRGHRKGYFSTFDYKYVSLWLSRITRTTLIIWLRFGLSRFWFARLMYFRPRA